MNRYHVGDVVLISVLITDPDDGSNPIDPDSVVLCLHNETTGDALRYSYGTDDEIARLSTGSYRATIQPESAGVWCGEWRTTLGAEPVSFFLRPSSC